MRIAARIGSPLAATLILLLPALWNGFALLEYDTGGYLARWFEGYLVPSRSTTYGLFLAAGAPLDFWPVVVLQAAAAVWVVSVLLRTHRFAVPPFGLSAIVAALAVTTALPWLASELLTDIFAGLAVLGFHALLRHRERIAPGERLALVVFIAFAVSTHSATYAVLLGLTLAALLFAWLTPKLVPRRGAAHATAAVTLGALMLLGGNYIVARQIAWGPGGFGIAFARMLQDGIVTRYLNDHCPDPRLKLCEYRNELPLDADQFLWDKNSVFERLGRFNGLDDEMRIIVLGSLRDYPLMQIRTALIATGKQLVDVGTGEGVGTDLWHTYGIMNRFTPKAADAMYDARQQRGEIGFERINELHEPVAWAAMALLPLLIFFGLRNGDFVDLGWLGTTVALALLANAAICGVISNPHDRYGSRMVWIAAFAVALAGWRAVELARQRAGRLRPITAARP